MTVAATTLAQRTRQKAQALELHLAGTPAKDIADQIGVTTQVARRLVKEGLAERVGDTQLSEQVQTEIARIDSMIAGMWVEAQDGNVNAVDRVAKLQERRAKLVTPRVNRHAMRNAFDETVRMSTETKPVDVGVIELGAQYCDRIDEAIATTEGPELTKALYLGPHILGVFKELLATPAARAAADRGDDDNVGGKLKALRAVAKGQRGS